MEEEGGAGGNNFALHGIGLSPGREVSRALWIYLYVNWTVNLVSQTFHTDMQAWKEPHHSDGLIWFFFADASGVVANSVLVSL